MKSRKVTDTLVFWHNALRFNAAQHPFGCGLYQAKPDIVCGLIEALDSLLLSKQR